MGNFTPLDYLVIAIYLATAIWLGLRFTKKQKSLDDYFVADRSAPWWAAGISVIAANFSAISYLGSPAWAYQHDLQLDFGIVFFPLQMLLVVTLFVPFLARLRLYTIYEYLEMRFGIAARLSASLLFILVRGGHLAFAIYAQSLALSLVLGLPILTCIWISGAATTLYTVFGGIEAVLWTDVMQFFVLVGGMFVILVAALLPFGGSFGEVWHIASEGGHTRLVSFNLDFTTTVTIWALFIGNLVGNLSAYGSDQVIVQRYFTAGSKKAMTKAVMLNGFLTVPLILLLDIIGLGFVAYYKTHPELRASLANPDQILPHFVTHVLPSPLPGLVIAGILAATMSTLSSGLNSLCTVTMVDFYRRFVPRHDGSEKEEVGTARCFTLGWGLLITFSAMFMGRLGQIVEGSMKALGFLSGPLLGMFLLGILSRRANSFGVLIGAAVGTACAAYAAQTSISWLWYGPVGCLGTVLVGYPLSFLRPTRQSESVARLTVWNRDSAETSEAAVTGGGAYRAALCRERSSR
ncbi:MAG TPA: sodium/solute symporter [Chthonomonadaceae bacterium]|nr:sodium/solute symporter [Chthonomonadaceae bacterium]